MADLYSYHIFLFPFKWDKKDTTASLMERIDMECFAETLKTNTHWVSASEKYNFQQNFNEHIYFYPHTKRALFECEGSNLVKNYEYKFKEQAIKQIKIGIRGFSKTKEITLTIDKVCLDIYATGIGLLSFFLTNEKNDDDYVLYINEYGRRLFPQYLFNGAEGAKGNFLADYIDFVGIDERDDFDVFSNQFTKANLIPSYIQKIIGNDVFKSYDITPMIDDRMFVMSWKGDTDFPKKDENDKRPTDRWTKNDILRLCSKDKEGNYNYLTSDKWYNYVFIDKKLPSVRNDKMMQELLKAATYTRWIEDNQLFGISKYSFVMNSPMSWATNQLKGNYFRIVQSVFLQRVSLIRFSEEIALLSHSNTVLATELYQLYLQFVSTFYQREIST
ncbi:MAG: hypothetical protein ACKVTZ_16480, partial [Bacteroidia bacterium]